MTDHADDYQRDNGVLGMALAVSSLALRFVGSVTLVSCIAPISIWQTRQRWRGLRATF